MSESSVLCPVTPARLAALLLVAAAVVIAPAHVRGLEGGQAMACEPEIELSVEATAAYDSAYGRYLDGIISNDSTVTVTGPVVEVTWVGPEGELSVQQYDEGESPVRRAWPRGDAIDPGQWTAFHVEWPDSVPANWTPVITAAGEQTDRDPLRLQVSDISEASVNGETGMRTYTATVVNDKAFAVSSIELVGVEWIGERFIDATFSWCEPEILAPGQSAEIEFHAKAPTDNPPIPDVFVEARERPVITLSYDTLEPNFGSPITFTMRLKRANGSPILGGRTLKLFYSTDNECWKYVPVETASGVATLRFWPNKPMYFKALYWGDSELGMTQSAVVHATPKIVKAKPKAPSKVRRNHKFRVTGRMSGGAASAGKPVKLRLYRYSPGSGKWSYKKTVKVTPDSAGRFKKSMRLSTSGKWKIKAYRSGVGYSRNEYLRVR